MLTLSGVTYQHPNKDILFNELSFVVNTHDKIALVGNNGTGKSTLLKILAGTLQPLKGSVKFNSTPYLVPQIFGQYNHCTVAEALGISDKLLALNEILNGNATTEHLVLLDDDWTVEERCFKALSEWQLEEINLSQAMETLSGGQKIKVFLAGITIHRPDIVLMDEPTNHLDQNGRVLLYDYLKNTRDTLVIVSHDQKLLNLLNPIYELGKSGLTHYGGNYEFYIEQKTIALTALNHDLKSHEKALRKAKEIEKETIARQEKLDARGKKKQEEAGIPKIFMNTLRNNAEKSTSRVKGIHAEKVSNIKKELKDLRSEITDAEKMKVAFDNSHFHQSRVLINAKHINFAYGEKLLWKNNLDFQIKSNDRLAIKGLNGSGKTTLIKMIQGKLLPSEGTLTSLKINSIYVDQDYSMINNKLSVYEQAQQFNTGILQEHDVKIRLNRFLFTKLDWDKPCSALSGGEKMRLILCCLTIATQAPDLIILDEPTNNLDIQNIEILTRAIIDYRGALLVVSHDEHFIEQVNIKQVIPLF